MVVLLVWAFTKDADKWDPVAEGVFDHIEYGRYHSVIYFDDGRTCLMRDWRVNMVHPKGTRLKISRNGIGQYRLYRIDKVDPARPEPKEA